MPRKKKAKTKKEPEQPKSWLDELDPGIKRTIIAVLFLVMAIIFSLSLVDLAGGLGSVLNKLLAKLVGGARFALPILLGIQAIFYLRRSKEQRLGLVWAGWALFFLGSLGLLHVFIDPEEMQKAATDGTGGGYLGYLLAFLMLKGLGIYAAVVICLAFILIGLLLALNSFWAKLFNGREEEEEEPAGQEKPAESQAKVSQEKIRLLSKIGGVLRGKEKEIGEEEPVEREVDLMKQDNLRLNHNNKRQKVKSSFSRKSQHSEWKLPPVSLLEKGSSKPNGGDVKKKSQIISKTLGDFGIAAEVVDTNVGPTVTQFAVRPADGTRLSKIVALQNDLAMALAAHPIRIEAPIPGKSLVGIEIPNEQSALVRFRSLIENPEFFNSEGLTVVLGEDAAGNHFYADVGEMPHLLIAGATGAGKSIGVAGIVSSLLYKFTPEELKFILVDPKRVELTIYNDIPHLITPVIVEIDKMINSLKWVVAEMERRYQVLQDAGSRDIGVYNAKIENQEKQEKPEGENGVKIGVKVEGEGAQPATEVTNEEEEPEEPEKLPFIVVIIDELADIMVANGKEVETLIVRIAQKARAVGIHLILSTQRPSVEIITGLIKANIPTRIAYQVASQIDSRTIIDMAGAEKLLGKGDMLFLSREAGQPKRIQGTFIQETEVQKVTDYWRKQAPADYDESVISARSTPGQGGAGIFDSFSGEEGGGGHEDELFEPAKQVVIEHQKASATLLQRKLKVGYARAARIMEMLEEEGVIGPANGAKPRDILIGKNNAEGVAYEDDMADQAVRDRWS